MFKILRINNKQNTSNKRFYFGNQTFSSIFGHIKYFFYANNPARNIQCGTQAIQA